MRDPRGRGFVDQAPGDEASELERLGAEPELLLNDWTWGERATGGMKLPGLLARSFELTL